ncbi:MAG: GNAT family N-acetyltransferase [Candidatus Aenigmatarchaeota archaeon]
MIREVEHGDLEAVLDVLHQLSPESRDVDRKRLEDVLDTIIHDTNHYLYVFEEDGEILGTGTLVVQENLTHAGKPYGHIENIVTDRDARGRGIGQTIVKHLIKKAKERGCYKTVLDCEEDLVGFYKKCGLNTTGEVQMRKDLG